MTIKFAIGKHKNHDSHVQSENMQSESNYFLNYACKGGNYFFKGGSISALKFEFAEIGPPGTIL